jgi:ribonuclease T2
METSGAFVNHKVFSGILLAAVLGAVLVPGANAFSRSQLASQPASQPTEVTPVVGQFDSLVFALSYQKDFCASHLDREECKPGTIPGGMGLHGLWPNRDDDPQHRYGYCDISEAEMGKDWCASPIDVKNKLTHAEFGILSLAMPGAKSCLYNHEWYTHGSCSGLPVEDYLMDASALTFQFWKLTSINELISDSAGTSLNREDFLKAIEKDLGPGARDSVTIECRYDHKAKVAYFSEIHISLNREKYMSFPAPESLRSLGKPRGSCPAEGIVVSE